MNPATHQKICAEIQEKYEARLSTLRTELAAAQADAVMLVWTLNNTSNDLYRQFGQHVMSVGGTGDLADCRTFVDSMQGVTK